MRQHSKEILRFDNLMSRKVKSRLTVALVFILCCVVIGAFLYAQLNLKEKNHKADLFTLVPTDAQAIVETNNINNLFQALEAAPYRQAYEELHFSALFNFLNHKIEELAEEKGHGLSVPMSNVLISFHAPGSSKDQVLYGHLGNGDQNLMDNILKELNTTGHTPKIIKYKGERITIYPLNNQEFLSCFFQDNCYAISYQKNLIEAVIDAYVSKESIRSDSLFSQIFQKKKSENTSRLYARTMPIAEWTQYDFQLQGDAIYLTGTCFQDEGKGNDRFPQISHIQPQLLSADYLPAKTYIFFQLGIKDIHGIVSTLAYNDSVVRKELYKDMPCDGEFYQFLEDYAKNEIDIVEFLGKDTTQSHRVMLIPLRDSLSSTLNAWKNIASRTWKQVWYDGHSYPFYTFPNNRLMKHLVSKRASTVEKLTSVMCKQHLLISDREEDIKAYLNKRSYTDLSHLFWEEKLGDLAPQADFTFFADMESVYRRPDEFRTMLPTFFFKHLDFFRQFTITIQFIESDERLSTNITLNYKVKA